MHILSPSLMSAFDYAIATTTTSTTTVAGGQSLLFTAAEVLAALVAIFVFGTLLTLVLTRAAKKAGASKPVTSSIRQWLAVLMIGSGIAAVASLTGISSQFTTLTLSGIAGLAFSLALQSTLSNVIAGILMLQEGVLRLGDEIEFGVVRGEVVKISLRSTWVKTDLGTIAVIGNSNLAAGPIMNHTARARLERKLQV